MTAPEPSSAPSWIGTLEGAGSLLVVAGVMSGLALVVTPAAWATFVPLGLGCIGVGVLVVRWCRARAAAAG
jgi:hypothetical protein